MGAKASPITDDLIVKQRAHANNEDIFKLSIAGSVWREFIVERSACHDIFMNPDTFRFTNMD